MGIVSQLTPFIETAHLCHRSPAEILPLQIREKGLALGNCCYWLFQFMMVEVSNQVMSAKGWPEGLTALDHANRFGEHLLQVSIAMA